jgi:acetylornithine/N-succinyldiaminopimelate aminotransferase
VLERRGVGLIQGIKVEEPAGEVISRALEAGLIVISARDNVIRLVPPLIIEKKHVDEMLEKLKRAIEA